MRSLHLMTRAFPGDPSWGVLWGGLGESESALEDWRTQFGVGGVRFGGG